ncbi:FAD-binding oxidoreductase [Motilibacter deserti]|uniref:FAD-binding oxidoreductase n=1 Tax=Motilibacter deserti TaxID=2714956 RepID=A0ABX0H253_9ACTN|nr:FAD-binding oxidoreductase [Motilibacter deserti]NHC15513.1 FAD-binding oxidoreductase [Motilibacter deserti]
MTAFPSTSAALVTAEDAAALAAQVAGPVLLPGADGFADDVSAFNLATTHHPAVVVGATNAQDVSAAVRFAATHGLPVAVQATGHGAVAAADGAVLVSTRRMTGLTVSAATATARVEAGVLMHSLLEAAAEAGLAPVCGSSPTVGVVGMTLGGGVGPISRKYGFAADRVRGFEIVTADGAVRSVDAESEPDLFWAVRGGKGGFGIVTALELELVPVQRFYAGGIMFPGESAAALLHAYREWAPTLPEETTTSIGLLRLPPLPSIPEPLRGQFVVHLRYAHLGSEEEGAALLAPMRAVAPAVMDMVGEMPFTNVGMVHMDPTDPMPVFERSALLDELGADVVEALLAAAGPGVQTPVLLAEVRHLGGATARATGGPNAVSGRGAEFSVFAVGVLMPEIAAVVPDAVRATLEAVAPWARPDRLLNFAGGLTRDELDTVWAPADLARLRAVKAAYDPQDVFRIGHTVAPAADARLPRQAEPTP